MHSVSEEFCKFKWKEMATNEEVRSIMQQQSRSIIIRKRHLTWLGHLLSMNNDGLSISQMPTGRIHPGRQLHTWRQTDLHGGRGDSRWQTTMEDPAVNLSASCTETTKSTYHIIRDLKNGDPPWLETVTDYRPVTQKLSVQICIPKNKNITSLVIKW